MVTKKIFIEENTLEEWESYFEKIGEKKFRAKQLFIAIHSQQVGDLNDITTISKDLREELKKEFHQKTLSLANVQTSQQKTELEGETTNKKVKKYLFKLNDGFSIEAVWLPFENRNSVCISVQKGCNLDCSFCATGKIPFRGNLTAAEIVAQVYYLQKDNNERVDNVVFMGMGEPFYNYDNSIKAAYLLNDKNGLNIGARHITISTSGVLPGIEQFVENEVPFNLALSLHCVDSEKRLKLMDIEASYPLKMIIEYLKNHRDKLKQNQLTIEYIMLKDFNMGKDDVTSLAWVAKELKAKVNLIPLNTNFGGYKRPLEADMENFWQSLQRKKVLVFNRRSPGRDIDGACGMLAGSKTIV